jgi:hypothetical protein
MQDKKQQQVQVGSTIADISKSKFSLYRDIDDSIAQYYELDVKQNNRFAPTLGAKVKIHYFQSQRGIDEVYEYFFELPLDRADRQIEWEGAIETEEDFSSYASTAPQEATFAPLPETVREDKGLKEAIRALKETIYRTKELEIFRCKSPKLESKVGERRANFMVRLQDLLVDAKETEIEKLQTRYRKKEKTLLDRLARAKERVDKESADSTGSIIETGIAVLGALLGKTSPSKIGTAVRKGSRVLKERGDMSRAQGRVKQIEADIEDLEYELEDKIDALASKYRVENYTVDSVSIKPRKSDIDVEQCVIVWKVV